MQESVRSVSSENSFDGQGALMHMVAAEMRHDFHIELVQGQCV